MFEGAGRTGARTAGIDTEISKLPTSREDEGILQFPLIKKVLNVYVWPVLS